MIVAASDNGVIGRDGDLPWRLPEDLKFFKRTTMGHPIIMGRKTFDSIGKPLPGRTNIVVSRQADLRIEGAVVCGSVAEAIERARQCEGGEEVFVIGGASIYEAALPLVTRIHLTRVRAHIEGDTYLGSLPEEFAEVERVAHPADDRHAYPFEFITLQRR